MITAEEARKITEMCTVPIELEKGIRENCANGIDFYVYCGELTQTQLTYLKIRGYRIICHKDFRGVDYVILW